MTKQIRYDNWCLLVGIVGLILCLTTLSIDGISFGIPFGIFGIAFAIISKKTDTWSKKSKIGLILSIIALVVGFVFFYITCITMETMSDPVKSKEVMEYMKELIPQMPEELQEMFNGYI